MIDSFSFFYFMAVFEEQVRDNLRVLVKIGHSLDGKGLRFSNGSTKICRHNGFI